MFFWRKRCGLWCLKASLLADTEGLSGSIHSIHFSAENMSLISVAQSTIFSTAATEQQPRVLCVTLRR